MANLVSLDPSINPYAVNGAGYKNNYVSTNPAYNKYANNTIRSGVLDAAIQAGPTYGYTAPANNAPQPGQNGYISPNTQAQDPYAAVRNDISGAWDSYLNSLNDTSGYLTDQRTAQEGVANSQYEQGVNTANTQKAISLKDIATNTRNAFQAANNYLGSLGAGDSSAANQYSFAINQQAGKQTGDLNNYVSSQIQNLGYQRDQQINQIASWFASSQQQLKQQIAQGQLGRGQDLANLSKGILDQAIAATNAVKANVQNQYNALLSWAANNSSNLGQLRSNIAQIPQAMGQIQLGSGYNTSPIGYGGAPTTGKTDLFGNPIA